MFREYHSLLSTKHALPATPSAYSIHTVPLPILSYSMLLASSSAFLHAFHAHTYLPWTGKEGWHLGHYPHDYYTFHFPAFPFVLPLQPFTLPAMVGLLHLYALPLPFTQLGLACYTHTTFALPLACLCLQKHTLLGLSGSDDGEGGEGAGSWAQWQPQAGI